MDEKEVRLLVRKLVCETAPLGGGEITTSSDLTVHLGFDSLELIGLAARLEEELGLRQVADSAIIEIETVGDIEELAVMMLSGGNSESSA